MNVNFTKLEKTHLRDGEITDYIKSNIKITDVVSNLGGLGLTTTGTSLQGDCPTGHESQGGRCFSINTDKNYFNCFHCGVAGDVIDLVKVVNGCSFTEALQWFKQNYNLEFTIHEPTVKNEPKEDNDYYNRQFLLEKIVEIGKTLLHNDKQGELALKYLVEDRGYNYELLKQT